MKWLVFVLALLPAALSAQSFSAGDRWLLAGSSALIVADWSQTVWAIRRGWSESNPILGEHPSVGRINTLIGLGLAANVLASQIKSRPVRRAIWATVIVFEVRAVVSGQFRGARLTLDF